MAFHSCSLRHMFLDISAPWKRCITGFFATLFPHISSTFFPHPLVIMVRPRPPRSGGRSWTATRRKVAKSWAILAFNWCGLYKAKIIWLIYVHIGPRFVCHKMPYCILLIHMKLCTYWFHRTLIASSQIWIAHLTQLYATMRAPHLHVCFLARKDGRSLHLAKVINGMLDNNWVSYFKQPQKSKEMAGEMFLGQVAVAC